MNHRRRRSRGSAGGWGLVRPQQVMWVVWPLLFVVKRPDPDVPRHLYCHQVKWVGARSRREQEEVRWRRSALGCAGARC